MATHPLFYTDTRVIHALRLPHGAACDAVPQICQVMRLSRDGLLCPHLPRWMEEMDHRDRHVAEPWRCQVTQWQDLDHDISAMGTHVDWTGEVSHPGILSPKGA